MDKIDTASMNLFLANVSILYPMKIPENLYSYILKSNALQEFN